MSKNNYYQGGHLINFYLWFNSLPCLTATSFFQANPCSSVHGILSVFFPHSGNEMTQVQSQGTIVDCYYFKIIFIFMKLSLTLIIIFKAIRLYTIKKLKLAKGKCQPNYFRGHRNTCVFTKQMCISLCSEAAHLSLRASLTQLNFDKGLKSFIHQLCNSFPKCTF